MKSPIVKNILFITSTRLGDAVISTGILSYLLKEYPTAEFTVACGSVAAGIFERMPRCKKILIIEKKRYDLHWFELWKQCVLQPWDLIIDLRGSVISYLLWSKKRMVIRGGRVKEKRVEYLAKAFNLQTIPMPVMWMSKQDIQFAQHYLPDNSYIALAPTANWAGKVWDVQRFILLAKELQKIFPNSQFAVFYGPGGQEYEMAKPLLDADLPIVDVGGNFTLSQVSAMFMRCRGFIGNDSGLMHLAAACQIPVLGLFGPSEVREYAPAGINAKAVVADGEEGKAAMSQLSVEKVFMAFKSLLNK